MNSRRSNIEVVADILRMKQASKTQIMYRVSMSYAQLEKYLDYLMTRGFLDWNTYEYRGGTYIVTQEGKALLESIERIEELLNFSNGYELTDNISQAIVTNKRQNGEIRQPTKVTAND